MSTASIDLRYPIGKYETRPYSDKQREEWLNDIRFLPQSVENSIAQLKEEQLDTPYREGGWTVRQLVHHIADSHLNAYCRFKLGLTEDRPAIRPYNEKAWSELIDVKEVPVHVSITLLHAVHTRWYSLVKHISGAQWDRIVVHPEYQKEMTLWYLLGMYAWHGRHHVAHITALRERNQWGKNC